MARIINSVEVAKVSCTRRSTGEVLGLIADLSEATRLKNVHVYYEILVAGHRSSPPHYHSRKEEFVYVLEGTPSVWLDGNITRIFPGHAVGFAPGTNSYHMVINDSDAEAKLLVVSITVDEDEVTYLEKEIVHEQQTHSQDYREYLDQGSTNGV